MKTVLVTGGTVFVSKYTADYFVKKGYDVYVLNRNSKKQVDGVTLIQADRHDLGNRLKNLHFDVVLDVTAYNAFDISCLIEGLGSFGTYIMISSSSVYPDDGAQPFLETSQLGDNKFWGQYGLDKIAAENRLLELVPDAYILRPPYLYGPMNNVYREAFVFDCAKDDLPFYLPRKGELKLQFFYIKDLCRMMEKIIENQPKEHLYNVGNSEAISVRQWVKLCYACSNKIPEFIEVFDEVNQRNYFSFYDYEFFLDVERQKKLLPDLTPIAIGLKESYTWYENHVFDIKKKPFFDYIEKHLKNTARDN